MTSSSDVTGDILNQEPQDRRMPANTHSQEHMPGEQRQGFLLLVIGSLYFAQGIPLGFTFYAFPAMLRAQGTPLEMIAWVPVLALPWAFKFLWAPLVDTYWLKRIGRRRSWLLSMQVLMVLAMCGLAYTQLAGQGTLLVGQGQIIGQGQKALWPFILLFIASLVSATQDIATDGLAAERLKSGALVRANTLSVGGMMAGVMVGGAATLLVIEKLGYHYTILGLTVLLGLCALPVLLWREDMAQDNTLGRRASLWRGIKRAHFLPVFIVASIYAIAHTTETTLTRLFLIDAGWQLEKIGVLTTVDSLSMIVLGCGLAAAIVMRLGTWFSAAIGLAISALTVLAWIGVNEQYLSPDLFLMIVISACSGMGFGLTAVAIFTIAMRFSGNGQQTGTDVTLFKSGNVVGELIAASVVTLVAAQAGYSWGLALGAFAALAAVVLIVFAARITRDLNLN